MNNRAGMIGMVEEITMVDRKATMVGVTKVDRKDTGVERTTEVEKTMEDKQVEATVLEDTMKVVEMIDMEGNKVADTVADRKIDMEVNKVVGMVTARKIDTVAPEDVSMRAVVLAMAPATQQAVKAMVGDIRAAVAATHPRTMTSVPPRNTLHPTALTILTCSPRLCPS